MKQQTRTAPKCKSCNVPMAKGKVLANPIPMNLMGQSAIPYGDDFSRRITEYRGGSASLLPAWKCPQCGRSISN